MNKKKIINKKLLTVPILALACLFSASLLGLEYVSAASFNSDGKAGQRESECVASFEGIDGVDRSAIEELCGRYNDSDQWAYSYSTYLTAHRTDAKELSKTDLSFNAIIQSVSNSSSQTHYANKTMTDKITSYTCIIEGYGTYGTCYTDLVGKTTGELKLGQNQSDVSSGSNFKVTIPGPLQSGNYRVKITVTSNVLINGSSTDGSFSTTELSELNFVFKNEPSIPSEIEDNNPKTDDLNIYIPSGDINFSLDTTQYLPVIMVCNPKVTVGELRMSGANANKNESGVYILDKGSSNFNAEVNMEAFISFDGVQPEVIYGQAVLNKTQAGDVSYQNACRSMGNRTETSTKRVTKTLENGELAEINNTGLKLKFDAGAQTVMYARPLHIQCNSGNGCTTTLGALVEWNDNFYSTITKDATASFFQNLATVIKGLFTGGIQCLGQLSGNSAVNDAGEADVANIFQNIMNYFACYADKVASDGSTLTAAMNALGNLGSLIKTVSSSITKDSIQKLKNNNKNTVEIPDDFAHIFVFREAESTLSLEASMSIADYSNKLESTPIKLKPNGITSGESKANKYITTSYKGKKITIKSDSTLSRLNYSDAGDKTFCNDGNGCDSPFHSISPDYKRNGDLIDPSKVNLGPVLQKSISGKYTEKDNTTSSTSYEEEAYYVELGDIKTYNHKYTSPQHEEIKFENSYDDKKELEATATAVIRHPWNYLLSFVGDKIDKDDYTGIVIPGETLNLESTIENVKNNQKDQKGPGDDSPKIELTLYYGALDQLPSNNGGVPNETNNLAIQQYISRSGWTRNVDIGPIKTSGKGSGDFSIKITKDDAGVDPGQYFCYYFGINYTNSINDGMYNESEYYEGGYGERHHENNQYTTRVICKLVSMTPTIEVRGGSLYSNGKITLKYHQKGRLGSWVDYGIVSRANVDGLASGYGFPNNGDDDVSCKDVPLSVNKDKCSEYVSNTTFSTGNNKVVHTPSFISRLDTFKQEKASGLYQDIELSEPITEGTGKYRYVKMDGGGSINNDNIDNKYTTIIYSKKEVTIEKNIELSSASLSNIPQVIIISDGDIKIRENVTRIDAWLIAKNGTIDTCSNYAAIRGDLIEKEEVNGNKIYYGNKCNKKLEINGPVIAKKIDLKRTYYENKDNKITDSTSEQFNIGDWVYFWIFAQSKDDAGYTKAYTRNLAPRL